MKKALHTIEQELWTMTWEDKVALFEMAVRYVGDDFARAHFAGNLKHLNGIIVSWEDGERTIRFFVRNPDDHIQKQHMQGRFYEQEELAIIARFFRQGSTYMDVGTNVGNHVIYVAKYLDPDKVIVFEPNPAACEVLEINVALNGLESLVDRKFLGIGLGDRSARADMETAAANLGATRLLMSGDEASIPVEAGDTLLREQQIDFIKIDVEGMELAALTGLAGVIERCRPSIFVEVDDRNSRGFEKWLATMSYAICETTRRSASNQNFMLVPVERNEAQQKQRG